MNKYQFLGLWSTTSIGGGVGGYYYGSAGGAEEGLAPVKPQEEWQKWWNDIVKNDHQNNDNTRRKLEYDLGRCSRSFWSKLGSLTDVNLKTLKKRKENSRGSTWKGCAHIDLRTAVRTNNSIVLAGRWELVVKNGDNGVILGGLVTPGNEKWDQLTFRGWRIDMKRTSGWWDLMSIKGWSESLDFVQANKEKLGSNNAPTGFGTSDNTDKSKGLIFGKGWITDSPWDDGENRLVRAYNVCKLENTSKSENNTSETLKEDDLKCPTYKDKTLPFDLKLNNTVFWTTKDTGKNAKSLKDLFSIKIAKGDGNSDDSKEISLWSKFDKSKQINVIESRDKNGVWTKPSNETIPTNNLAKELHLDEKYQLENLEY